MRQRTTAAAAVLAAALSTVAITVVMPASATADPISVPGYAFRVIGERTLSLDNVSGIDYSAATDEWYLISDQSPARFYGADLALAAEGFGGVTVNGSTLLREADGTSFPYGTDPEAIRVNPADGSLLWASEGRREVPRWGSPTLVDPTVRRAAVDGTFVAQHPTAPFHAASTEQQGPRDNRGIEGLTLNTGGTLAISATEGPLIQDGAEPTRQAGAPVRMNFANRDNGTVVSQLVYELDANPAPARGTNGLTEILAKDARNYLVLERAKLDNGRYSVRLYEANTVGARSALAFPSLAGTDYTPMTKRLLVDFGALGLDRVANLEGMAWGPTLPSGERTLVFVSDNECDGRTQLVALGVTLS
jgi:hypothetical protein